MDENSKFVTIIDEEVKDRCGLSRRQMLKWGAILGAFRAPWLMAVSPPGSLTIIV